MSPTEIGALVVAGVALGGLLVRIYERYSARGNDAATADKLKEEAKKTAQETAAGEVGYLREIIAEVRSSEAKKTERIDNLERRLELLEERERHMLTRAAVHEAWDQLAFQSLLAQNPSHPPPPPLAISERD